MEVYSLSGRIWDRNSDEYTDWFDLVSLHKTAVGAYEAGVAYATDHILKDRFQYVEEWLENIITKSNFKKLKKLAHEIELIRTEGETFLWPEYDAVGYLSEEPKLVKSLTSLFKVMNDDYRKKFLDLFKYKFFEVTRNQVVN